MTGSDRETARRGRAGDPDSNGQVDASDSNDHDGGSDSSGHDGGSRGRSGRRFVLALYVGLVAAAAVAGLLTGTFVEDLRPPRFLFLVPFPATPLGIAAYGGLTVALVLGVPLALVRYVSRDIDGA